MNKRMLVNNVIFFEMISAIIVFLLIYLGDSASRGIYIGLNVPYDVWWGIATVVFIGSEAVTILCVKKQKRFDEYQFEIASGWRVKARSIALIVIAVFAVIGLGTGMAEMFVVFGLVLVWMILLAEAFAELLLEAKA